MLFVLRDFVLPSAAGKFRFLPIGLPVEAVLLVSGLLSGCSSTAPPMASAIPYQVKLNAGVNINPDILGRPSPIVVRVFELRSGGAFESNDFFSLQNRPELALGRELIGMEQVTLYPGEVKYVAGAGSPDARNIGILAEYRELDAKRWRLLIGLPLPRQSKSWFFWRSPPDRLSLSVDIKNDCVYFLPVAHKQ
ncbi:type VI secretion system lipoprotein TssJ [Azotobacter chroococcum]|nr:type VI secretion system lipoprotein TssJ [Azotobacter chroococcum]